MSKDIEAVALVEDNLSLESEHIKVVAGLGIEIEGCPSIDEWHTALLKLTTLDGTIQWYLGDLMVYAESPTTGWGESKYDSLMKNTPYKLGSLMNYASVARRFPISTRKQIMSGEENTSRHREVFGVTFGHFQCVTSLPDEVALHYLNMVKEKRWTVAKLRDEVQAYKERNGQITIDTETNENGEYIPTFNEAFKDTATWAKNFAKQNGADIVRIQIVKNDEVIEEKLVEVY